MTASEWGVPDWTDAAAYPSPVGRGRMLVWAWEFLRRNHEYRNYWTEKASRVVIEGNYIGPEGSAVFREGKERFGIIDFPTNPALPARPLFEAIAIRELRSSSARQPYSINPRIDEIGYLFDLTLPLEGQFSRALKDARELQKFRENRGEIKWKNPRERSENFVSYLRILDADHEGAENRAIAAALFPNLSNERPDYQGNARLKDHRKRARELRDSDYRLLAALAIAPGNAREAL